MRLFSLLVIALLLFGIACGNESISPLESSESTDVPTRTPRPTGTLALVVERPTSTPLATARPLTAATTQERIVEDATLVRLGPEPPTLDPHLATDSDSAFYIVEIFGGLVTIDRNLHT